jgi:hypothetical protein
MAAGIASSSFSAAVALTLPICGGLFDRHLHSAAFNLVAVLPIGATIWWLFPVRPALAPAEAARLGY